MPFLNGRGGAVFDRGNEPSTARVTMCCAYLLGRDTTFFLPAHNAAGALKLLGEAFPWQEGSHFVYTRDNHNSVLGIREVAMEQGAAATCVEMHAASGTLVYQYC